MGQAQTLYGKRQNRLYFRFLLWLAGWTFWVVSNTYFRLMPRTTINEDIFDRINAQPLKGIAVPWHCYVPYGLWMARNLGVATMSSRSNFGSVAAAITARMGGMPVRGGSARGGKEALAGVISYVEKGHWALIVGDAPRGPAFISKIGPILAAQKTGRPIIPVSFAAKRRWALNTWDGMIIPKPFSPVVWVWGDPFYVPRDLDREGLEKKRQELDALLQESHQQAQRYWD